MVVSAALVCAGFVLLLCSILTYPQRSDLWFVCLSTLGTYLHPHPEIFSSSLVCIGTGLLIYVSTLRQIPSRCQSHWSAFVSMAKWHAVLLILTGLIRYDQFPFLHVSVFLGWIIASSILGFHWKRMASESGRLTLLDRFLYLAFPVACLGGLFALSIPSLSHVVQKVVIGIIAMWYAKSIATLAKFRPCERTIQPAAEFSVAIRMVGTVETKRVLRRTWMRRSIAGAGIVMYLLIGDWARTRIDWAVNFPARIPETDVAADCSFAAINSIEIADRDVAGSLQTYPASQELPVSIRLKFKPGTVCNGQPLFASAFQDEVDEELPRATAYVEFMRFSTLNGGCVKAASCRDRVQLDASSVCNLRATMGMPASRGEYLCVVRVLRKWQRNLKTTNSEWTTVAAFPVRIDEKE
ncbi:MAG: hypothetical protein U0996_19060 [Planctomycetaceae bacterium]